MNAYAAPCAHPSFLLRDDFLVAQAREAADA